jgi:hypothetical protein
MKKLLLLVCIALIAHATYAQDDENGQRRLSFTLSAGSSLAFFSFKPQLSATSLQNEASLGGFADYRVNDYFSIAPGLLIAGKGGHNEDYYNLYGYQVITDYHLYYLEEAVNFVGHIPLGGAANLFVGAGPFFANGIYGRKKVSVAGSDQDSRVKFGSNGDISSIDYGLSTMVGFKTRSRFSFALNFDLGTTNIHPLNPGIGDIQEYKTRSIYATLGYSIR